MRKIAALEIIFTCPVWPMRDDLTPTGQTLFDMMTEDAKQYALHLVDDDFPAALTILGQWSKGLNEFIDQTMISGNEHAERMVWVYRHYADAFGADFNAIHNE